MDIYVTQSGTNSGGNYVLDVQVDENNTSSRHTVTMDQKYYLDLGTSISVEDVVKETFLFLLDRESKEMILSKFDITVVSHYFPEFSDYIKNKVS